MESRKLALLCRQLADEKKAEDLIILDVREVSSVTDYFVLGTGTSEPHLRAIAQEITENLRMEHGSRPRAVDGTLQAGWVVMDFTDVIVHLMRREQRLKYDLEGLWGDAPRVRNTARSRSKASRVPARRS